MTIRTSRLFPTVRTESQEPPTISRASKPGAVPKRLDPISAGRKRRGLSGLTEANLDDSGFTLVEILIVLAIIALVLSIGLPAISRVTNQRLNSTTRKFVGLVHELRNDSILLNSIHRLVIDFDRQAYWVEQQREFKLLGDPLDEIKAKKAKNPPPNNYVLVEKYSKKPIELPDGVVFDGVLNEHDGFHAKQGVAFINFFPNGFNDQAIIYMNRAGSKSEGYSVVIRPTAGRVEIFREKVQSFD